jgi:hypothetical protein
MQIKINPVNNINVTIKVEKIDNKYYGQVEETLKVD